MENREELDVALHDRHHALPPLLLVVGDVSAHLEEGNHVLVALRLVPLRRILELMFQCPRAMGQNQVVTLGLVLLPGQHLLVVDLLLRLVLLDLEVVFLILQYWWIVLDCAPGPRPLPVVGLDRPGRVSLVLSRRNSWLLKLWGLESRHRLRCY